VNNIQNIIFISLMFLGIFFMPNFSYATNIYVTADTQNIPCWWTDLYIWINTNGNKVIAADIKFFLQGLSISSFIPLSWFDNSSYIWTWISTKWENFGKIYHYINVHQNSYINAITGNNIIIGKIRVTPILGNPIGLFNFYNLSGNDEDSNISIGTEYWTEWYPIKYIDWLSSTTNGIYNMLNCIIVGWWGGWTSINKDNCTLSTSTLACANTQGNDNSSSYYDGTCCSPIEEWHSVANTCNVLDSTYTSEITDAFQRAYNINITTKCPITSASLEHPIIRMEAAKMMSMFTIQILWLYPDTHKVGCDNFPDTKNISDEMQFFTKTACQLNLMGLKSDGKTVDKNFDPYGYVNRAQFGTILSRLIYWDKYNVYLWEENVFKRYQKHLNALKADNIIKNIQNPFMLEERARVLLMLKRTVENNLTEKYRLVSPLYNWQLSLLENVR